MYPVGEKASSCRDRMENIGVFESRLSGGRGPEEKMRVARVAG